MDRRTAAPDGRTRPLDIDKMGRCSVTAIARDDVLRRAENAEWSPKEGRGYIPGTYLERVGRATRFPFSHTSGRSIECPNRWLHLENSR